MRPKKTSFLPRLTDAQGCDDTPWLVRSGLWPGRDSTTIPAHTVPSLLPARRAKQVRQRPLRRLLAVVVEYMVFLCVTDSSSTTSMHISDRYYDFSITLIVFMERITHGTITPIVH